MVYSNNRQGCSRIVENTKNQAKTMPKIAHRRRIEFFLLWVILTEGYILLSTELLAIRLSIPFVGSGTDTISIIIAAVLLPLAFGYYQGGQSKRAPRRKLASNFLIALAFLTAGLSYVVVDLFFTTVRNTGILDRRILTALYAALFIAAPVFLLGQTIPLASHYFKKHILSEVTGKILFYSTLGSFLGATFSTLVLMAYAGVHVTVTLSLVLLALLYLSFTKWNIGAQSALVVLLLALGAFLNSGWMMDRFNIVSNNPYNTVVTFEKDDKRFLFTNSSASSMYTADGHKFPYIEAIEKFALGPIWNAKTPHDILVVGAGGFTLGHEDYSNHYDFVDIDKTLKEIAERDILKEKIPPNHKFHDADIRGFLNTTDKKYDVIVLDAYSGKYTLPEHLLTIEFFEQVKTHLKDKGVLAANFIFTPSFTSPFARNLDHTFRSVYPSAMTYVLNEKYDLWNEVPDYESQVLYFYKNREDDGIPKIYSDMKNSAYADRPGKR